MLSNVDKIKALIADMALSHAHELACDTKIAEQINSSVLTKDWYDDVEQHGGLTSTQLAQQLNRRQPQHLAELLDTLNRYTEVFEGNVYFRAQQAEAVERPDLKCLTYEQLAITLGIQPRINDDYLA